MNTDGVTPATAGEAMETSTESPSRLRRLSNLGRGFITLVVGSITLGLVTWALPGMTARSSASIVLAQVVVAALNAFLWPIIVRKLSFLLVWTVGIGGLLFNAAALMAASNLVDGFDVRSWGSALLGSLGVTAVTVSTAGILAVDDDAVYQRNVIRAAARRAGNVAPTDEPGFLFIQIDGLGIPVLSHALQSGHIPAMSKWLHDGQYHLTEWECDLSSQTGASQAGILHGDNENMPAFRWFDKESGAVITTNRPSDAATIEASRHGEELLVDGVSRTNIFTGGSSDSLFTFSTILSGTEDLSGGLKPFFADPYAVSRMLVLSVADIARELAASWRARRRGVSPRLKRGGIYAIARAATTVMLREMTISTLIGDIYRGVPVAYVDLVGYDEVAHHSGVLAPDALEVLYRIDRQIARVAAAAADGPRTYHLVVLSDHGQSQGATFKQRYDLGLGDYVTSLLESDQTVAQPKLPSEGWGNINAALSDVIQTPNSRSARLLGRLLKKRTVDGEVTLGADPDGGEVSEEEDVVVLASGNLGLISFPQIEGRATLEEVSRRYPNLIPGLVQHDGIGFVLIKSESEGGMVFGASGVCYLDDGSVEGDDPLEPFGPDALHHLRRTNGFDNTPDLLVNSFFDPVLQEGCAFEELIGFHGGMGGWQTRPFVLAPTELDLPSEKMIGATRINELFRSWRNTDLGEADAVMATSPGGQ